jgi:glutaredoxin
VTGGAERSQVPVVTVFGKPDCHLCDQALELLRAMSEREGFQIVERDITLDEDLHRAYFERIPVIALEGEELSDYFVDEARLRDALTRHRSAPRR